MKGYKKKLSCSYECLKRSFDKEVKFPPIPWSFFFHRKQVNFGKLEQNRLLLQINFEAMKCKRDWKWILNQQMAPTILVGEIERDGDGLIVQYCFKKSLYVKVFANLAVFGGW